MDHDPVIAIDPGKNGAVCLLRGTELLVFDTPTVELSRPGRGKVTEYEVTEMARILGHLINLSKRPSVRLRAVIEEPYYPPTEARQTTVVTAEGVGLWKGMLTITGHFPRTVPASVWKPQAFSGSGLGAASIPLKLKGKDREKAKRVRDKLLKNNSRELARRLFPGHAGLFERVGDHNRSDAVLLAYWMQQHLAGAYSK